MTQQSIFSNASGFTLNGGSFNTIDFVEGYVTNNANFDSGDFRRVFENSNRGDAGHDEASARRVKNYYGNVYKVINKGNHNRVNNDTQVDYHYDSKAVSSRLITRALPDTDSEDEEDDHEDDIDDPNQSLLPQRRKPPGTAIDDVYHPLQQSPEPHDSEVDPLPLPTPTSLSIIPSTSTPPAEVPVMEILTVAAETQSSEGNAPAKSTCTGSVTFTCTCSRCTIQ